jgi:hypothetical protein
MSKGQSRKKTLDPDLAWLHEPEEGSLPDKRNYEDKNLPEGPSVWESISYGLRSILAVFLCLVIPALWYFDWNPSALANETSEVVTNLIEGAPPPPVPLAPPPPSPPGTGATSGTGLTDYVAMFKQSPYAEQFSTVEITAFYQSGVTMEYLDELNAAGYLDELSFPAIITYFQSGVTTEYLDQMKAGGYLNQFSFPGIAGFYKAGVTLDFLNELKEKNLLDDLSFAEVLVMFENR